MVATMRQSTSNRSRFTMQHGNDWREKKNEYYSVEIRHLTIVAQQTQPWLYQLSNYVKLSIAFEMKLAEFLYSPNIHTFY